jgi:protein TonB
VDLEDFSDEAPMETSQKPKPVPTPVAPTGAGGALSSGAQEMPAYYLNPPPPYPEEARHLKQEGLVTIHVEVDAEGKVSSDSLAQSSGFPLLDDSALQTVRGWRFKPARIAGIAVSKGVDIPVRFRLKDARW